MTAATGIRAAALPSEAGAPRAVLSSGDHTAPVAVPAELFKAMLDPNPEPDIQTRAFRLFGLMSNGALDVDAMLREVGYGQKGLPVCDSCQLRSAQLKRGLYSLCPGCYVEGLDFGDVC